MKSLILIGSKSLCLKILKIILKQKFIIKCLITFDDTYDQRSYFKKIKSFCKRKKVKLFVVENNKYESEEIIKRYKIDYVLVIGWYKLFSKRIDFLILDKFFLKNKKIQDLKIKKYYYTIKKRSEFKKYSKNNNLIFENL